LLQRRSETQPARRAAEQA